ncbi:polymorphic toxin type 50 domain-containing protein [Helicobacter cynogastricus]|uniref:polymorphic toxin type 50 domain-containing protein n=1 Tax=Helicobacter cynogastricus TaxID=329937 RepID=UPI000CF18F75|nr:polymorphic toxin type 50 domain-containing protein [Helicobacter cynogastricus]
MSFLEAIDSLMERNPTLIVDGAKFKFNEYLRVFSIAKVARLDIIQDTQNALKKALEQGLSAQQFLKAHPNLVQELGKKRLMRVFAQNLIYANTRGKMLRYENAPPIADSSDGDGWYFVFHSRHDSRARHLAYDGICLPRKHEFWKTHTPPLDWGCRCEIQMWSERQIKAKGIEVTKNIPQGSAKEDGHYEPDAPTFIKNLLASKRQTYKDNPKALEVLENIHKKGEQKTQSFNALAKAFLKGEVFKLGQLFKEVVHLNPLQKGIDAFDAFLAKEALEGNMVAKVGQNAFFKRIGQWYKLDLSADVGVLSKIKELPTWDIKKIAQRQEDEGDLEMEGRIKAALEMWLPTLKLDDKQEWHILTSPGYIQGRSYYEHPLDAEALKRLIRNARIRVKNGKNWNEKIIIEHPDFEGVVLPHEKTSTDKPVRTRKSKVHFSNNSFHIVPYIGEL